MAVCNLFSSLDKSAGNFMLFSQYVEDITHNFTEGDNYKVVPSRFVALDIDYNNINIPSTNDLNIDIPKYFQNYFENACAYGRNNIIEWNPLMSRNAFWNSLFDGGLISFITSGETKVSPQVKYWGEINMQSYNEHNGIGYNELYCYIPSNAGKYKCQVIVESNRVAVSNPNEYLEGYAGQEIGNLSGYLNNRTYYYNDDYKMSFDDSDIASVEEFSTQYYDINTIVVLYDIQHKDASGNWTTYNNYKYIPMGMYICGKFENENLSNVIRKYVNTSYDLGTAYGLRICTRFTVSPQGAIIREVDLTTDSDNYIALNQLMTAMGENLNTMLEISSSSVNTLQQCKDALSSIKNKSVNVPYVKTINGKDYWFVNGKMISEVNLNCCNELSDEDVDGVLCGCNEIDINELADILGVTINGSGNNNNNDESNDTNSSCTCEINYATDSDIASILNISEL